MVLSGCASIRKYYQAPTVEITPSPQPTPTPSVTATPEVTATALITEAEKNKSVVEKMVTDFFAKAGDFSDGRIIELALSPRGMMETGLGVYVIGYDTGMAAYQCVIFDIKQDESFRYYLLGSVDQNGKRFVFVMKDILEDNMMAKVNKSKMIGTGDNPKTFFIDSEENAKYLLELYRGKPVIAASAFGNWAKALEGHVKDDPGRTDFLLKAIDFVNASSPLTENLFQRLKNLSPDSIFTSMPSDTPDYILSTDEQFSFDNWESFSGLAPNISMLDLREDTGNW